MQMRKIGSAVLGVGLSTVGAAALAATATYSIGTSTGPGGILQLFGATSGSVSIETPAAAGSNTQTLQAVTDTFAYLGTVQAFLAPQGFVGLTETDTALTGCNGSTATMDMTLGTVFHCTVSAGGVTFAVSNPAASGKVSAFTLELTNPGSQTLTWMSGTKWPGGSQPAWTAAGVDVVACYTRDAATTWRCARSMEDSK